MRDKTTHTSALDWRPGPKLRTEMDTDPDRIMACYMVRDELGGWSLTVRRFGCQPLLTAGTTAQEAADRMEERL